MPVVSSEVLYCLNWVNNGNGVWLSPPSSDTLTKQLYFYPEQDGQPLCFEREMVASLPDQWQVLAWMAMANIPVGGARMAVEPTPMVLTRALGWTEHSTLNNVYNSMPNAANQRVARNGPAEWSYSDIEPKSWRRIPAPATVREVVLLMSALKIPLRECMTR